jgi:hypothetical protein
MIDLLVKGISNRIFQTSLGIRGFVKHLCENTKRVEITGIAKAYFNDYVDRVSVCQNWA